MYFNSLMVKLQEMELKRHGGSWVFVIGYDLIKTKLVSPQKRYILTLEEQPNPDDQKAFIACFTRDVEVTGASRGALA